MDRAANGTITGDALPAPSPRSTDTTVAREDGLSKWKVTAPPGVSTVDGKDHDEVGASTPSSSASPPWPGWPYCSSSEATTWPETVDTSVPMSGSSNTCSPSDSTTKDPAGRPSSW